MSKKTLTEFKDRSGETFMAHLVGDRTYPDFPAWHDEDYSVMLDAIKNLEVRPGDLYVCGFPKSGNHWFYEIITMVLAQSSDYTPKTLSQEHVDLIPVAQLKARLNLPKPARMFSHLNPDSIPASIPQRGGKVIYVVRNFKDVCVSWYEYVRTVRLMSPYKGKWEDFLEIFLQPPGYAYGLWLDHVKQADVYQRTHPDVPFHVLCYELMKANPVEEIKKLCKFLEVPDTLAEEIADKVSFQKMRPAMKEGKMSAFLGAMCEPGTPGLFRKGEVGDWRRMFTKEQSDRVDKLVQEHLADSPIGKTLKPYME